MSLLFQLASQAEEFVIFSRHVSSEGNRLCHWSPIKLDETSPPSSSWDLGIIHRKHSFWFFPDGGGMGYKSVFRCNQLLWPAPRGSPYSKSPPPLRKHLLSVCILVPIPLNGRILPMPFGECQRSGSPVLLLWGIFDLGKITHFRDTLRGAKLLRLYF